MGNIDRKKVLVVDDEPGVRRLVSKILSGHYKVIEAPDGEAAVNEVRSRRPGVVIMDMMMPRMDGLTACYAIKKDPINQDIKVIMLTAVNQDLNKKLSTTVMGADRYITKPFKAEELLDTIKQLQNGQVYDNGK